jgi:hypothetical protein
MNICHYLKTGWNSSWKTGGITAVLLVFLAISYACTKKQEPNNTIPLVKFEVNRRLLGDSILSKVHKVSFFVPKDWKPLPKDIEEKLRLRLSEQNIGEIRPQPMYLFVGEKSKATLIVSTLDFPQQDSTVALKKAHFVRKVQSQIDSTMLRVSEFRKGTMPLVQCVIRTPTQITFKILIEAETTLLQFDYIIPMAIYNNEIRAVESSIGSIFTIQ